MGELIVATGGCHCGAVKWEADVPATIEVHACNCSICDMVGYEHLIVPASRFRLLTDEENLSLYTFNKGIAQHYFCKTCGVKSHYIPRSNPDGFSVNLRCMDRSVFDEITIKPLDGRNWEKNAGALAALSQE